MFGERRQAGLGAAHALTTLESEGLGHDADGQGASLTRELRDHGSRAGAGAAAHAGGDEDHVGALDDLLQPVHVLQRRLATFLGVGAGAQAARHAGADRDLLDGGIGAERLSVGVDRDELDAFEAEVDHGVDGVATRATDADNLDARFIDARFLRELD